jgi:uncharacterized lipoprotein YajG
MKISDKYTNLFILLFVISLSSCATNRSVLTITPKEDLPSSPLEKFAVIRTVTDAREFMDKPPTPDIPSLGQGGISNHSTELRSRAIGRKRNGYGKALGDVFLDETNSVQKLVNNTLTNILNKYGYKIIDLNSNYPQDTIFIDVQINKFWSWIDIGFWSIGIEAEIDTNVTIVYNENKSKIISARTSNRVMVATDSAWKETIDIVLQSYKKSAEKELEFLSMQK